MPKQQLTIKSFEGGIVTTQPASDLLQNQYSFGYDIDSSYPGGIRGRASDEVWKTGAGSNGKVSIRAELDNNYQALVADSTVYLYQDGDATVGSGYNMSNVGSSVTMQAYNKAIHIGTGSADNSVPKWLGIVNHIQFGNPASPSPALYNASIEIPNTIQGYSFGLGWKGCTDNNGGYIYIDRSGKRITRFSSVAPYFDKTSDDLFQNITAICGDPESPGDILAFDNETSTLYRIDVGPMTVKTATQLGSQLSKNGYLVTDIETTSTDIYFAVTALGGFVEEIPIKNKLSEQDSSIPGIFLYKIAKSNLAGTGNLLDISPNVTRSTDLYAYVTTGLVSSYVSINNLENYSVKLKLGTKCLFRASSSTVGLYGSINIIGTSDTGVVSDSLYVKYQDTPPSNEYREIPFNGSFIYISNGQPKAKYDRTNMHPVTDALPDVTVWLSYNNTTLRRAYYNNSGGQNYYGTTTITLSNTIGAGVSFTDTSVSTSLVKNASMVFTGSFYYMLNGDGLLDPAARYADTSTGALVSSIGTMYVTEEPNGFTESNKTYYYKFSLLYDGFQESPLISTESYISPSSGKKIKVIVFVPSSINRRVSHLNIYRSESGGISGYAKSFYQLVESVSLAANVAETTSSFGSTSVTGRKFEYVDNFTINQLGPTYESNAGLSEVVSTSTVHYGLSCQQGGYHFVTNCWHPVLLEGAKQYVFRSAQGQFDTFNYFSNFIRLPETPVALISFKSRIFAFGKNKIWRINPDGFYIEDEMNGFGTLSQNSVVTTDFGMFFASNNGIYISDGGAPVDISLTINKNYSSETYNSIDPSWLTRDKSKVVSLNYDPRNRQVIVAYWPNGSTTYKFLVYSVDQRRWDLWSGDTFGTALSAPGVTINGIPTFWSDGGVVRTVSTSVTDKAITYYSPYFDFREPAIEKWVYNVKLQLRDALPTTVSLQIDDETPLSLTNPILEEGTALPLSGKEAIYRYDVPQTNGNYQKGKRVRIAINAPSGCKIDSIDFTYRDKMFKGGL